MLSFFELSSSNYGGYDYSYGYGAPTFYNNYSLSSVPYGLTSPVQNYYGSYLSSWDPSSLPYWSDDSRWREAADLAYYQQRLAADRALSESERMMRWQQRLGELHCHSFFDDMASVNAMVVAARRVGSS